MQITQVPSFFYVVFTHRKYEIYLVSVLDDIDSDNYQKYKISEEILDKSTILGGEYEEKEKEECSDANY